MSTKLEKKTPAQNLAATLTSHMNKAIDASGLRPYLDLYRGLAPFTVVSFKEQERVEGYANARFEVAFGVSVEMTFKTESFYDDRAPHAMVGMASIGEHGPAMALARSTLYAKAAQAAALFDAGAEYAYDAFNRAQEKAKARAQDAKVVA